MSSRAVGAWSLVISVEHGGNEVPPEYSHLFRGAGRVLGSHRGWDPGALELATQLAAEWDAPLVASTTTRLLVDLNRSTHHPHVFSEFTGPLDQPQRQALLATWHAPHRKAVETEASRAVNRGKRVLHLSVHSFTPVLNGVRRKPDLALLYDPGRSAERKLAGAWVQGLADALPELRIRRNDPYRGTADGLTTSLRSAFPDRDYCGIEIELNQRVLGPAGGVPTSICGAVIETLRSVLESPSAV